VVTLCGLSLTDQVRPDLPDVHGRVFLGRAATLREHAGIRVQPGHLLEQVNKADSKHAWAAAPVSSTGRYPPRVDPVTTPMPTRGTITN
jgi:hypothetical protein